MSVLPAFDVRRIPLWGGASLGLVLLLAFYCELHSLVSGGPLPGWRVSIPWALQVSCGWLLSIVAATHGGPAVLRTRIARCHPHSVALASAVVLGSLAVAGELLARSLDAPSDWSAGHVSVAGLVYARAPVAMLGGLVLVGGCLLFSRGHRVSDESPVRAQQPSEAHGADGELQERASRSHLMEVMTGTGRTTIRIDEIECLRADRNYVTIVHNSGRTYLVRQTMAAIEQQLDAKQFLRIHRSAIVNLAMVRERRAGGVFVLRGGLVVQASRTFRRRGKSGTA